MISQSRHCALRQINRDAFKPLTEFIFSLFLMNRIDTDQGRAGSHAASVCQPADKSR
jgi:hypothetical protein